MDTNNAGSGVDQKMDDSEPQIQSTDKQATCGVKHKLDDVDKEARKKQKKIQHKQNRLEKKFQKAQQHKTETENEGVVTADQLKETTYTIKNGLRHVVPYYFDFKVIAKGRWKDGVLLDLFTKEFSQLPRQVYEAKIKRGDITVNGEIVETNYKVKEKDEIIHRVHRHEPPVTAAPVSILYANDEFVVVNKPGSMPVHPCGRFRHNSLLFVLASEHKQKNLYTVNRLDRLTSGLLVLARSSSIAARISSQISSNLVEKKYLARVRGEFPEGEVVVDQPIKVVNIRQGINCVSPDGKPSKTIFNRKSFDKESNTSVVQCQPITGRTHQIRIHLQHLGFPIANDPVYNNDPRVNKIGLTSDGNSLPLFGEDDDDIIVSPLPSLPPNPTQTTENNNNNNNTTNNNNNNIENNNNGDNETTKEVDPECTDCNTLRTDPKPEDMYIYLHAYSYKSPDWHFETDLPLWAIVI